jgi:hypothetical protein
MDGVSVDLDSFIKQIDYNVTNFKFNKVVSEFMTFYNTNKNIVIDDKTKHELTKLLKVFYPDFN